MVKHNIIIVANLTLIIHVYVMWLFFGLCNIIIIFFEIVLQLCIIILINNIDSLLCV